jgi:CheY-like chemotaxis protein
MPVLGGAEMIERLRADMRTSAIPIVVVSATTAPAQWLHASGLIQAVVRKPFDIHALVACIEEFTGDAGDELRALPPPA